MHTDHTALAYRSIEPPFTKPSSYAPGYNDGFVFVYVTGFGKTLRMGFFQKVEFDVWLISSSIELTHIQVLGRSHTSLLRYSALFAIVPHPQ